MILPLTVLVRQHDFPSLPIERGANKRSTEYREYVLVGVWIILFILRNVPFLLISSVQGGSLKGDVDEEYGLRGFIVRLAGSR